MARLTPEDFQPLLDGRARSFEVVVPDGYQVFIQPTDVSVDIKTTACWVELMSEWVPVRGDEIGCGDLALLSRQGAGVLRLTLDPDILSRDFRPTIDPEDDPSGQLRADIRRTAVMLQLPKDLLFHVFEGEGATVEIAEGFSQLIKADLRANCAFVGAGCLEVTTVDSADQPLMRVRDHYAELVWSKRQGVVRGGAAFELRYQGPKPLYVADNVAVVDLGSGIGHTA